MLAAILNSQGIHTGYHISPHIDNYTERMWIDGEDLSEKKFTGVFNEIYPIIQEVNKMDLDGPVTQFEIISAMAFKLAENENIEVMALEAGMGGRWDATNIADSKVVGLTGVSLEHTEILGKTIRDITLEKVEVIKENALVATTSGNKEVLEILSDKAEKTGSGLFLYGKDFYIQKKKNMGLKGWTLDIKGINDTYENLTLPLLGQYQPLNLSLAITLAELYMGTKGKKINKEKLRKDISGIQIKGRLEIIRKEPMIILDAGHNPEGAENFVKNISYYFGEKKKIIKFALKISTINDIISITGSITNLENIVCKYKI